MLVSFPYFEFDLSAGEAVSLDDMAGWTLASVCGRIWLTEASGDGDIWLLAGDKHEIRHGGRVVVEAWLPADAPLHSTAKIRLRPPVSTLGRRFHLPRLVSRGAAVVA